MKQGQGTGDTSSVAAKPRHLLLEDASSVGRADATAIKSTTGPRPVVLKGKAITVVEYVHTADGGLVRVDQLEPEQYERFRQWLGCTYLNELYRGQAEFYYPEAGQTAAAGG